MMVPFPPWNLTDGVGIHFIAQEYELRYVFVFLPMTLLLNITLTIFTAIDGVGIHLSGHLFVFLAMTQLGRCQVRVDPYSVDFYSRACRLNHTPKDQSAYMPGGPMQWIPSTTQASALLGVQHTDYSAGES